MSRALSFDAELIGPWVAEKTGGTWHKGRGTAMGKLVNGEIVAGILYEDYSGTNIVCHIAGVGNWADRELIWMIFDYPFNQIKVNRMTAPICSTNEKSIRLVEHFGFKIEAKLHGATSKGDLLLYTMFRDDCKYLRGRYGKERRRTSTT
jgi:RimJ/RimL family protein N-acetyltransferase